jgi:hypothetical protein
MSADGGSRRIRNPQRCKSRAVLGPAATHRSLGGLQRYARNWHRGLGGAGRQIFVRCLDRSGIHCKEEDGDRGHRELFAAGNLGIGFEGFSSWTVLNLVVRWSPLCAVVRLTKKLNVALGATATLGNRS